MKKRPGGALASSSGPVSRSQLFPVLSTGLAWREKAYLAPAIITVILMTALFVVRAPDAYNRLLGVYLTGGSFYFIYRLCGKPKPWWLLAGAALITGLILRMPGLYEAYVYPFILLASPIKGNGLVPSFFRMLFVAGLPEELMKAWPVLGAYWLGSRLKSPWRERVGVWEPLDGILLGAASAVGFILVETLFLYVPGQMQQWASQYGVGVGLWAGLQLLIPRMLQGIAGHMAYSGYLGYFIGLSALKPTSRWQILGVGYLTAAGVHALWDSTDAFGSLMPLALIAVGGATYVFLAAAILKARQISPTRSQNFATEVIGSSTPTFPARFSLQVGGRAIALYSDIKVREHDIPGAQAQAGDGVVAQVNHHPNDPMVLGLKNLSQGMWTVTVAAGSVRRVRPGQSIKLAARTKIDFGPIDGEIRS